jgi:hypothetical protein
MPIRSIEHILGAAARGVLHRAESAPHGVPVRTQSAVVRSLVYELEHRDPLDACLADLREQVKEELLRLMRLVHAPDCETADVRAAS